MHALARETPNAKRTDACGSAAEPELRARLPFADKRPSNPIANRESHSLAKS
jgi:hypothetical protein